MFPARKKHIMSFKFLNSFISFPGRTPEGLLPSFKQFRVYYKLYMAVTTDLLDKMMPQDNKRGKETDRKTKRSPVRNNLKSEEEMLENRFAFLCDIGEQD